MRLATRVVCLALAGAALLLPAGAGAVQKAPAAAAAPKFSVLVLTEGNPAVGGAVSVLQRAGAAANPQFDVDQVKNSANGFTDRHLSKYNVVVLLNNGGGDVLDADEQASFEKWFHGGGGLVAVGSRDPDEPRLAVPHRRAGHAGHGRRGGAGWDDQGRRPRPRREQEPAAVLELLATRTTTSRPTSAA